MKPLIAMLRIFCLIILLFPTASPLAVQAPSSDIAEVVRANNAFAVELYQQLKSQPGNLFFSPESISTALAMAYAGARGDTAAEMAKVLHFTVPPERLHPAMSALLAHLNAAHDGYQLKVADALWGQQGYTFLNDFLKITKDNYGAGFNQVNFAATEQARQTINSWIEQQTANKISNLIAQGLLTPKTRLVLTNAIYFKGGWETQFRKEATMSESFYLSTSQIKKASLMHRSGDFNYLDGGTFQALEIPYKNNELSMVVFLPKDKDANGLADLEQSLTPDALQQWLAQLRPTSAVIVAIPKFEMIEKSRLENALGTMGIQHAFGAGADFTGMASKEMQKAGDLYIGAVIHQAFVDVNEEGSEAVAATAILMPPPPPVAHFGPPSINFRVDHPFLFVIREKGSDSILFMGRVADPTN